MNYILKYYIKSKYLGYTKCYYHEFNDTPEIREFLKKHKKEIKDFTIYIESTFAYSLFN